MDDADIFRQDTAPRFGMGRDMLARHRRGLLRLPVVPAAKTAAAYEARGAVDRGLWSSLYPCRVALKAGLLRFCGALVQGSGTVKAQLWSGSVRSAAADAGASVGRCLTRLSPAIYRAFSCVRRAFAPSQPCIDELPSYASYSNACPLRPDGLYARPDGTGVQKLFRRQYQRYRLWRDARLWRRTATL